MTSPNTSQSAARLEPPRPSMDDPGAHDLDSSENEDDHFSDASEGQLRRASVGSGHYGFDTEEKSTSAEDNPGPHRRKPSVQDRPIPTTVVEKVDPFTPSYGEVPGTMAYEQRQADAEPDVVMGQDKPLEKNSPDKGASDALPVPITKVTRVDSSPRHGDVPGTEAHEKRKGDAAPDVVEEQEDVPGLSSPSFHLIPTRALAEARSPTSAGLSRRGSSAVTLRSAGAVETETWSDETDQDDDTLRGGDTAPADDFDDFEEGQDADDFGDFDEGVTEEVFEAPGPSVPVLSEAPLSFSGSISPPLDFSTLDGLDAIVEATQRVVDGMFSDHLVRTSPLPDLTDPPDSIFIAERSRSLWTQLVTAPPLPPPNWVRSRIRRLFLVSLGVPVDLDEILPSAKQKKLVLPSPHPSSDTNGTSGNASDGGGTPGHGASTQGGASSRSPQTSNQTRARGKVVAPPPELDEAAARRLCTMTEAALTQLTDEELQQHIQQLERFTQQAQETLDYWLRRRDDGQGDKAAFEGVIENLVKHARRVRK